MADSTENLLGDLLQEITSKRNWYAKVFDETLVKRWKAEFLEQNKTENAGDLFDLMINFAQSTAQGSIHRQNCSWTECGGLCNKCIEKKKKEILENPHDFNFEEENLKTIFQNDEWIHELEFQCKHPKCSCIAPDFKLHNYLEYSLRGLLSNQLRASLKEAINEMLLKEPIDWHPGSNQQVRDLVHPSMYCYVKGQSLVQGKAEEACKEEVRYQWLPAEFKIRNKEVKISSYINNLDFEKYPRMQPLLEKTFEAFLPGLETVLKRPLRNADLQVIVKIGQILLTSENPEYAGGSWHIEGTPHENIAASCIHYLEVEGLTPSFLEFRKPVLLNEENAEYPQCAYDYTEHHFGIEKDSHSDGQMNRYLGAINCSEGTSVVFPNSLQHRVKPFSLAKNATRAHRTILVFFVVHPEKRIISTESVLPQQKVFSPAEAEHHRNRLMFHRKYFVNKLNEVVFERPYSLCEH